MALIIEEYEKEIKFDSENRVIVTDAIIEDEEIENKITEFDENITKQELEIIVLTEEYARMIYFANRNTMNQNPIIFIISAKVHTLIPNLSDLFHFNIFS